MRIKVLAIIAGGLVVASSCTRDNKKPVQNAASTTENAAMSSEMSVVFTNAQVVNGDIGWEVVAVSGFGAAAVVPGVLGPNEDRTARLGAPASGRIVSVRVRPGDNVRAGQVLLTLNSPEATSAQSDVDKARAQLASERARASYAASARARAERLLALKAIPRQDYERAIADDELARAGMLQAEAELRRSLNMARQYGASAASGQTVLSSPLSGVVLERQAVPGTVVEAGAPLITVSQLATLWLTVSVPEKYAPLLRKGAPLSFTVPAYGARTFAGRIDAVGAGLDAQTRTIDIRAIVANNSAQLRPGMLATVTLQADQQAAGVMLPADAVQTLMGKTVVFLAEPAAGGSTRFVAREVAVGERTSTNVVIRTGLAGGERVVTKGAFTVKAQIEKAGMPEMEM